jgi:hypothetical protein
MRRRSAFYFDDGNGHWVVIRGWLPYGHPERVTVG